MSTMMLCMEVARPPSAIAALVCAGALSIGGCFGGGAGTGTDGSARAPRPDGLVEVHTITYSSSFDGRRVRGTVAIPRAGSRGCVLWQDGQGSNEEASAAWQALGSLGAHHGLDRVPAPGCPRVPVGGVRPRARHGCRPAQRGRLRRGAAVLPAKRRLCRGRPRRHGRHAPGCRRRTGQGGGAGGDARDLPRGLAHARQARGSGAEPLALGPGSLHRADLAAARVDPQRSRRPGHSTIERPPAPGSRAPAEDDRGIPRRCRPLRGVLLPPTTARPSRPSCFATSSSRRTESPEV